MEKSSMAMPQGSLGLAKLGFLDVQGGITGGQSGAHVCGPVQRSGPEIHAPGSRDKGLSKIPGEGTPTVSSDIRMVVGEMGCQRRLRKKVAGRRKIRGVQGHGSQDRGSALSRANGGQRGGGKGRPY